MEFATIERDELKDLLTGNGDVKLVMTLNEWAFNAKRIPGSVHFATADEAFGGLGVDETVVVYCSDPACVASQYAYRALVDAGYSNVRRYAGGLSDWEAAGYPLEGDAVVPDRQP